jgi:hypothetical protein
MRSVRSHIEKAGLFTWRNLDAVFVIVAGAVVAVLQVAGHPSMEAVDAAILGLLAVVALILLRAREERTELDEIREVARDALSERPFQMVWARIAWPSGSPPFAVEMRVGAQPARELFPRKRGGRMEVAEKIPRLAVGEVAEIRWFW